MSLDNILLEILSKPVARRGGIAFNLFGLPVFSQYKKKTIQNRLSYLKQKQFVAYEGSSMVITKSGREYLKRRSVLMRTFDGTSLKGKPKNLIVIFDIPEIRKGEREWFRRQLKAFGYEMVQRSVWFGPSPLPKEFIQYVTTVGLIDAVKVFKASPLTLNNYK